MSKLVLKNSFTLMAVVLLMVGINHAQNLKVFISVDMEGITGVVHSDQVTSTGSDYNLARKWMTQETNAAIQGALDAGATEIIVNDSHGDMRNIILSELHPSATLITGTPKPLSMMQGIDSTFDAVMFIGYHAKAGTADGILDHTYAGATVYSIKINGIEMPELGINALLAGYFNVPVVLVSGDKATCQQAKEILGEKVVTIPVKEGIGRYAAKTMPLEKAHHLLRQQVKSAIQKRKEIPLYKLNPPYKFEFSYLRSSQADMAMLIPTVKRIDSRTVQFEENDVLTGFKLLRALIALGREN